MAEKPWRDEERLRELYIEEGIDQPEIAEMMGCSRDTIWRWCEKFDIQRPWKDPDKLRELYWEEGLSLSECADKLGCSAQNVKNWLDKTGLGTRSQSQAQVTNTAPICLNNWGHESIYHQYKGENYGVLVHRLLAVAEFGHDAVVENVIHHKNGIPWDNRPENLEPMSAEEHNRLHRFSNSVHD